MLLNRLILLNRFKPPPQLYFIFLIVPRRYSSDLVMCLLGPVSVSVLFSPSMRLDDILLGLGSLVATF